MLLTKAIEDQIIEIPCQNPECNGTLSTSYGQLSQNNQVECPMCQFIHTINSNHEEKLAEINALLKKSFGGKKVIKLG